MPWSGIGVDIYDMVGVAVKVRQGKCDWKKVSQTINGRTKDVVPLKCKSKLSLYFFRLNSLLRYNRHSTINLEDVNNKCEWFEFNGIYSRIIKLAQVNYLK